ncbi:MAG: quinolinate synthase NadA [Dehalococcoidales bacterium]|nr:quinolinate synthase NadA [Dehalococcoidales bacterium]
MNTVSEKIDACKKEKNAVIVAHYYQCGETQDIADFVGDAVGMTRKAVESSADVVIVGGVTCMAETISLACPDKTVILPDVNAGCTLSNMISLKRLPTRKAQYPDAAVACYINTTPEVKTEIDFCFGEDESLDIISQIPAGKEVMYIPDQYLGDYASTKTGRDLILWPGYCSPIVKIRAEEVKARRLEYPDAQVVAHIQCTPQVKLLADAVTTTNGIVRFARETSARTVIVAAEVGILHYLKKENPGKTFIAASELGSCATMKLVTQEAVLWSLEHLSPVIEIPEDIRKKAKPVVDAMLARR